MLACSEASCTGTESNGAYMPFKDVPMLNYSIARNSGMQLMLMKQQSF
jgi:hypothetical protein